MNAFLRSVLIVVGAVSAPVVVAAGDAEAGKAAYAVCVACHGTQAEGNAAMNAPKLAGQHPWYLKRQLENYKSGARGKAPGDVYGMQMAPMAMTLPTPEAIDNVVAYITSLPAGTSPVTIEGDAAAGQVSYAVCAACHGPEADGLEALGGPRLAGQNDWYLVRQLQNYKNNLRGYDPRDTYGAQMKPMASTLADDQAIKNVVAYINSLQKQ